MKKIFSLTLTVLLLLSLVSCSIGTGCGTECSAHIDVDANMYCDNCGAIFVCPGHADADENGYCDNCSALFEECESHSDANKDGQCDICAAPYVCPGHKDRAGDGQCDICLAYFVCPGHKDLDNNGICDSCVASFKCINHKDIDPVDGYCDSCEASYICESHKDADVNSVCDLCGADYSCPGHRDADGNGVCDECAASTSFVGGVVNPKSVAAFVRAYSNSLPTNVTTYCERTVGIGNESFKLKSESSLLTGSVAGKNAAIYYESYQTLRSVEEGSGDTEEKVFKTITTKKEYLQDRGVRITDENGVRSSWDKSKPNFAPAKGSIALNINENNITVNAFEVSDNSHVMRFTVDNENVEEVFGTNGVLPNIDANKSVNVTLISNGATISSVIISYSLSSTKDMPAQSVVIEVEYKYSIQNITID